MKVRSRLAPLAVLLLAACSGKDVAETPAPQVSYGLFPNLVDYRPMYPQGTCMTEIEVLADQFIKLRTEMMITSLTCPTSYRDPELYKRYVDFTFDHQDEITASQETLGDLLGRIKRGNDRRLFDTFQTEMANVESQNVSKVSVNTYCQARWEQFNAVAQFDPEELTAYLKEAAELHRDDYTICG
ncbi:MAG TPA: hypothetical protein VFO41_10515 [Alphaproteobacteria bacterium]|nr:hypothetical protein [Alphaproteobacteria bacterium]